MRFFFYGTLMDADVRRAVLGAAAPATVEPATLAGWRRVPVAGASYPMIVRAAGSRVEGVFARGLDQRARDRLIAYESDGYRMMEAIVTLATDGKSRRAFVFVPDRRRGAAAPRKRGHGAWHLASWQRRHKRRFLARLASAGSAPLADG